MEQKEKIVALMNMIESELDELVLVPGAGTRAGRVYLLAKYVKWAVRDGEKLNLDQIRKELAEIKDVDIDEEDKIIDPTGIELTPGDPGRCAGNGKEDPMTCCCDECNYFLECFPEWAPGGAAWKEH